MKKYYCSITQQVPDRLRKLIYASSDAALKRDEATAFPITALIAGSTKKGEKIGIYAILPDHENSRANLEVLKAEIAELAKRVGFYYDLILINTPFSENQDDHLDLFGKLIDTAEEGDNIYADITYGTKPIPIIMLMSLTYTYRFRKDASVERLCYGQVDHNTGRGEIFDVTAMFYMNCALNAISESHDPKALLKTMIEM